jgi:hypothetical protein
VACFAGSRAGAAVLVWEARATSDNTVAFVAVVASLVHLKCPNLAPTLGGCIEDTGAALPSAVYRLVSGVDRQDLRISTYEGAPRPTSSSRISVSVTLTQYLLVSPPTFHRRLALVAALARVLCYLHAHGVFLISLSEGDITVGPTGEPSLSLGGAILRRYAVGGLNAGTSHGVTWQPDSLAFGYLARSILGFDRRGTELGIARRADGLRAILEACGRPDPGHDRPVLPEIEHALSMALLPRPMHLPAPAPPVQEMRFGPLPVPICALCGAVAVVALTVEGSGLGYEWRCGGCRGMPGLERAALPQTRPLLVHPSPPASSPLALLPIVCHPQSGPAPAHIISPSSAAVAEAVAEDAATRAAEEDAARKARAVDMDRLRVIRAEEEKELDEMRAEVTAMGEGMARMRLALVQARQEAERLAREEKRLLQAQHRAAHQIARHAAQEGLQGEIAEFMASVMSGGGPPGAGGAGSSLGASAVEMTVEGGSASEA